MPKTHTQYGKEDGGTCPPGYTLRHVKGHWVCVSDAGEEIKPHSSAPGNPIVNPCPEGYELVPGVNGAWMCRNRSNGVTITPEAAKSRPRVGTTKKKDPPNILPHVNPKPAP